MSDIPQEHSSRSSYQKVPDSLTQKGVFDTSGFTSADKVKYESLIVDTQPIRSGIYENKTFFQILESEKPLTDEKVRNLIQIVEKENSQYWKKIFEINYNNGDKTAAATERKSWSEEMKDAYRTWKTEVSKGIDTKVINIGSEADRAIKVASEQALVLLDQTTQGAINTQTEKELTELEKNPESTDTRIIRGTDGQIDRDATRARIQAHILVYNAPYLSSRVDQKNQQEFQTYINSLRGIIGEPIIGKPKVLEAIKGDPSLPSSVQKRHLETTEVVLKDATNITGRRYPDGTYSIDYTNGAQKERLILDGMGNVTRTRAGLSISTNSLRNRLDTEEQEYREKKNKEVDTEKNALMGTTYKLLGQREQSINKLSPDKQKKLPDPTSIIGNMRTLEGDITKKDRKKGAETLETLKHQMQSDRTIVNTLYEETNLDDSDRGVLENMYKDSLALERKLDEIDQNIKKYIPPPDAESTFSGKMRKFDTNATSNLNLLVSQKIDKMGPPDGDEALQRIIRFINNRNPATPIDLTERLPETETRIQRAMRQLGGTEQVVTSSDVGAFRKRISKMVSVPPDDLESIESKLADKPKSELS